MINKELLRAIPSVDEIIMSGGLKEEFNLYDPRIVKDIIRGVIEGLRGALLRGATDAVTIDDVIKGVKGRLKGLTASGPKRVVNATGTVLHTNLGRAILSRSAIETMVFAAQGPVDLELDLGSAKRGDRDNAIEELLVCLTGGESACVVNNNAAAVLLVLNTLAEGKEVIISRGELVEIGASFRLPDIIKKSGCILKEVGATNITRASDYTSAITPDTALILKAHKSNYKLIGFTEEVSLKELVNIGKVHNLPVVFDLGSGALIDTAQFGLEREPWARECIEDGADVVTFSGDKLLGGPQSGLIAGKKEFIKKIKENPLKRALRVDKLTIGALIATLKLYLTPALLKEELPTMKFLTRPIEDIERVAEEAKGLLRNTLGSGFTVEIEDGSSIAGGGSLPLCAIPTKLIVITHERKEAREVFKDFLANNPPILGRINSERFILDLRTVESAIEVCPSAV